MIVEKIAIGVDHGNADFQIILAGICETGIDQCACAGAQNRALSPDIILSEGGSKLKRAHDNDRDDTRNDESRNGFYGFGHDAFGHGDFRFRFGVNCLI